MIALLNNSDLDFKIKFEALLARGAMDIKSVEESIKGLLDEIKSQGKDALLAQV